METSSLHSPSTALVPVASWDEIERNLRRSEDGRPGALDVELRPGGTLVLTGGRRGSQPLSQLPKGRMAAATPDPSPGDVDMLRQLDHGNRERWTPVSAGDLAGWVFRMTPPFAGQSPYVFFAFRSPSDGNAYRIAVLDPDMDHEYGHTPHMIRTHVGGRRVPVICGPSGRPAIDLAEARTHAAKWMAYTSCIAAGLDPGFSR